MALIRNLDPDSTGFICWRQLLTYFILIQSKVPSQQEVAVLQQIADADGYIGKEAFVGASYWFERAEESKDAPHHLPFERIRFIKEELFRANAEPVEGKEDRMIQKDVLAARLRHPARPGVTVFNDFIFAGVKRSQN